MALIVSVISAQYLRWVMEATRREVVRAALRLWRRICEQNENNMLMGAAGSRDMGKLGNSRQLLHSLVEGAHLSKYYDTKNSAILGSRTKALLGHFIFLSFRLAKAHPFCLKLHWSNVLTKTGIRVYALFSLGCGGLILSVLSLLWPQTQPISCKTILSTRKRKAQTVMLTSVNGVMLSPYFTLRSNYQVVWGNQ